jgi:hypothetical protein
MKGKKAPQGKPIRLYGSLDGETFFAMVQAKYLKKPRLYGSYDNGETFFPLRFENDYREMVVEGNPRIGKLVKAREVPGLLE